MYLQHHYAVDLVGGSLRKSCAKYWIIHVTNTNQLAELSSISQRPSSYLDSSQTKCSAGIMTTLKLVKTPQQRAMPSQICEVGHMRMRMSGLLVLRLLSLLRR